MTAKEYLSQAYRLDQRINSNIEEVTMLREMASSISSPSWGEKVQTSRSTEAPLYGALKRSWIWRTPSTRKSTPLSV